MFDETRLIEQRFGVEQTNGRIEISRLSTVLSRQRCCHGMMQVIAVCASQISREFFALQQQQQQQQAIFLYKQSTPRLLPLTGATIAATVRVSAFSP